jgi:hypothetical protein
MSSPTQRTLQHLRAAGFPLVQVVERWNPHARIRQDLYGCIDVLAVGNEIVAVHRLRAAVTSPPGCGSSPTARRSRSCERPASACSYTAGARFRGRWQLREVDVS